MLLDLGGVPDLSALASLRREFDLMVTSVRRFPGEWSATLELGPLPVEAAIELLQVHRSKALPHARPADLESLARTFGGLPLALELVGRALHLAPRIAAKILEQVCESELASVGAQQLFAEQIHNLRGLEAKGRQLTNGTFQIKRIPGDRA